MSVALRSAMARLPDFLCIGAQRSGTTTLHRLLARHPAVHAVPRKELQYFTLHADRSPEWYASHFSGARRTQVTGESTPYYLFHEQVPARVAAALPHVRLLVLLRDPVARAISGYFHSRRLRHEPLDIEEAFAAEGSRLSGADAALAIPGGQHHGHRFHSYLSRSRYDIQLARWLAHVPRARMLLLRSEDFFAAPARAWEELQRFLGIPAMPLPGNVLAHNGGQGEARSVSPGFRDTLRRRLADTYVAMQRDYGMTWPRADEPPATPG